MYGIALCLTQGLVVIALYPKRAFSLVFHALIFFLTYTALLISELSVEIPVSLNSEKIYGIGIIYNITLIVTELVLRGLPHKPRAKKILKILKSHVFLKVSVIPALFVGIFNFKKGMVAVTEGYIESYNVVGNGGLNLNSFFPFVIICFIGYYYLNRQKTRVEYVALMMFIGLSFISYGARSFIFYVIMVILAVSLDEKRSIPIKAAFYFLLMIVCFVLIGGIREGAVNLNILVRLAIELGSIPIILENLEIIGEINHGLPAAILSVFPHSILISLGITPLNSLSTEFVFAFDRGWAQAGGGFGFAYFAEIKYRFGLVGFVFMPILMHLWLNYLQKLMKNCRNVVQKSAVLLIYLSMLMWGRGDLVEIFRLTAFGGGVYLTTKIFKRYNSA